MSLNRIDRSFSDDDIRALLSGSIPQRRLTYYLDENLMAEWMLEELRAQEIFVTSPALRGLASEESDYIILSDARSIAAILVTQDQGFKQIDRRIRSIAGASHAGIMIFGHRYILESILPVLFRYHEKLVEDAALLHNQIMEFGKIRG